MISPTAKSAPSENDVAETHTTSTPLSAKTPFINILRSAASSNCPDEAGSMMFAGCPVTVQIPLIDPAPVTRSRVSPAVNGDVISYFAQKEPFASGK